MVFVNGYCKQQTPPFIILSPDEIYKYTQQARKTFGETGLPTKSGHFINKKSYRYKISWFDTWNTLPPIDKKTRLQYDYILKMFDDQQK